MEQFNLIVNLFKIIFYHSVARKLRCQRRDCISHSADPFCRKSVFIQLVKRRNNFIFQNLIKRFGIVCINLLPESILLHHSKTPIEKPFCPLSPSIHQPSRIERFKAAVHRRFLSARSARFHRTARNIHPDINALNQITRDFLIVIFNKYRAALPLRIIVQAPSDFARPTLPFLSCGCAFPAKTN